MAVVQCINKKGINQESDQGCFNPEVVTCVPGVTPGINQEAHEQDETDKAIFRQCPNI